MRSRPLREMVDLVLDQAEMENPHVRFSVWLSPDNAAAFAATYRRHEVVGSGLVGDELVRLEPVLDGTVGSARASSYVADLDEEIISVFGSVLDVARITAVSATAAARALPDGPRALQA